MHGLVRRIRRGAVPLLGIWVAATTASAQDWPSRNVTIVVPLAAGSASDISARVVADQLGKQLNRTFVVENRPGAGGTTGAGMVAKAAPDGHTILAYGALSTANALYAKLPYDTLNDFIPIITLGQQAQAITTAPSKGYKTLGDRGPRVLAGVPRLENGRSALLARRQHERVARLKDQHRSRIGLQHRIEELRLIVGESQRGEVLLLVGRSSFDGSEEDHGIGFARRLDGIGGAIFDEGKREMEVRTTAALVVLEHEVVGATRFECRDGAASSGRVLGPVLDDALAVE